MADGDIFDKITNSSPKGDIFDKISTTPAPVPVQAPAPDTSPIDPISGMRMTKIQAQGPPGKVLPYIGGGIGGAVGGPAGAALGGIAGEGLKQALQPSANPPLEMLKSGGEQAAYEVGGKLIGGVANKLVPAALKRSAATALRGPMDTAGQAIDRYLAQPNLAAQRVNIAQPINDLLDDKILLARKTGATSLAKKLETLQTTWNTNYNLTNPTLPEANQFRREIADFTSFASDSHKESINAIQKQINGIVGSKLTEVAPGLAPLNQNYSNLVSMQSAFKGAAKSVTTGVKGGMLAGTSLGLKGTASLFPTVARGEELVRKKNQ